MLRKVIQTICGAGAMARPRYAVVAVILLLVFGGFAWILITQPWNRSGFSVASSSQSTSASDLSNTLARSGYGPDGVDIRMLWATPEYFRFTGQLSSAAQYDVERHLVFFIWENIHDHDLGEPLWPQLRIDGGTIIEPSRVISPASAAHHRFSVVLYRSFNEQGLQVITPETRSLEIILPPVNSESASSVLYWPLPVEYGETLIPAEFQLSWATLLALLGGVLAAMWPCFFQLTAYFIPTLAGISVAQTQKKDSSAAVRLRVLKTAVFFVLGFIIVYTIAGAVAGFTAQSLGGASLFSALQRPLSIAAGIVILIAAVRLAANARAPLVCKMPIANFLGKKNTGYLGTMVLGLAFAVGCTTCFGAALMLGLIAYVGIAGTPFLGALVMFLFALGMAVPLVAGALFMARILSFLGRLERVAPYMLFASSVIMVGFAILLLSGQYMAFSNLIFGGISLR